MTFASGMSEAIYMGFEASFKNLPAPASVTANKLPVINPRFTPSVSRFTSEALSGSAQPRPPAYGKQGLDFSWELEASKDSVGPPFKAHFGDPTTQYPYTGFYDHYFGFGTMPSFFVEDRQTDISKYLVTQGLYAGSLDTTIDAEGLYKITFGGMGAFLKKTFAATVIDSTITDLTGELPLNMVNGSVYVDGVKVATFQTITLRSNRGVDKRNHIDETTEVGVIFSQIASVSGTARFTFTDTDLMEKAMNSTEVRLEFLMPEAGTGHGIKYVLPTCVFRPGYPETAGTGLRSVSLDFDAYARGTASDIAAEILGKYIGLGTIVGMDTKTLVVKPDALADETFTFAAADDTLAEVVAKINATATGLTAVAEFGRLRLYSKTKGTSSKIRIQAGSTALTELGLTSGVDYTGFASQALMVRVSNTHATIA